MALIEKTKKIKKSKKKKLSKEELRERAAQRAFERVIRSIFARSGFRRIAGVSGKEFNFGGAGEFDDAFQFENVTLLVEYTLSSGSNVGTHIKNKAHLYERIRQKPAEFLATLGEQVPAIKLVLADTYHDDQRIVRIVYCSKAEVQASHQGLCKEVSFLSWAGIRYFHRLATTLKKSARFEIFDFLNVNPDEIGSAGSVQSGVNASTFDGSLLPEAHSNFPAGFKVVSFYVDPGSVLRRAYVLRRDGWRDSLNVYQRMIIPKKISAIRRYLKDKHRVFANNVVLTLPDTTEILAPDGKAADPKKLVKSTPVRVRIPDRANTVGIVDGQHRIFSYYEDIDADPVIDHYRGQQNLLATGIIYPEGTEAAEKERFEAELFLEINSNQASAKSDLKQAISLILDPFAPLSVARRIVQRLAESGPLDGILERNLFDPGKLKTTTIVSYGMQPLVKLGGSDSIFSIWPNQDRERLKDKLDRVLLSEYLAFAEEHVRDFFIMLKKAYGDDAWDVKRKGADGILSVTTVNAFIILMRLLIADGLVTSNSIKVDLKKIVGLDIGKAKSSQYASLAAKMRLALN
jgi:DGQHR domain-containing protein